jgi:hypothetical protein
MNRGGLAQVKLKVSFVPSSHSKVTLGYHDHRVLRMLVIAG